MFKPQNIEPSLRAFLRKQVKGLLRSYVDIGGRVYACRPHPILLEHLPCVTFYPLEEPADHRDSAPRIYHKEYGLIIEILCEEPANLTDLENIEDFLDSRAFEVEYAMLHDISLELGENGNWIDDVKLLTTVASRQIYEGSMNVAALKQSFVIEYNNECFAYDSLDEFKSFINSMTTTDDAEAVDDVTIRT